MIRIENHSRLNSKLWTSDGLMHDDVAEVLKRIYISVMTVLSTYTKVPMKLDLDTQDIIVCGSCVGYNYNKKSDIDLYIVINGDRYLKKMSPNVLDIFINFTLGFYIKKYQPKIKGMGIDINIVGFYTYDFPRYSLLYGNWYKKPTRFDNADIKYVQHRAELLERALRRRIRALLKDKSRHHECKKMLYDIRRRRAESWVENFRALPPYSVAYSKLKHDGYLKKLYDADTNLTKWMMNSCSD